MVEVAVIVTAGSVVVKTSVVVKVLVVYTESVTELIETVTYVVVEVRVM
jgi:hypothetical protein